MRIVLKCGRMALEITGGQAVTYNQNKKKYNIEYKASNMKRIPLDVQKTEYEEIKESADRANESVNGYIRKSIRMRIDSEKESE